MADLFIDTSARLYVSDDSCRLQRYPVAELGLRPRSTEDGSKLKGIVPPRPFLDVAAEDTLLDSSSGRRNVDVQPAPRISNSTRVGAGTDMVMTAETTTRFTSSIAFYSYLGRGQSNSWL